MCNKITRIGLDFEHHTFQRWNSYTADGLAISTFVPAIIIHRGSGFDGTTRRYPITSMATLNRIQRITSNSGAVKVDSRDRVMWYRNVWEGYNSFEYHSPYLHFKVLPNWKLEITLTNEGKTEIEDMLTTIGEPQVRAYFEAYKDDVVWNSLSLDDKSAALAIVNSVAISELEPELLEYALGNGWTLDPDDDGRNFIMCDGGIADNGELDLEPGMLGWFYNEYVYRSWVAELVRSGSVTFGCYYLGECDLTDQRTLAY